MRFSFLFFWGVVITVFNVHKACNFISSHFMHVKENAYKKLYSKIRQNLHLKSHLRHIGSF